MRLVEAIGTPARFGASLAALLAVTGGLAYWTWDRFRTDERGHLIRAVRNLAEEAEPARLELAESLASSMPPRNVPIPKADPTKTLQLLVGRPMVEAAFAVSGGRSGPGRYSPHARMVIWRRYQARVPIGTGGQTRCCEPALDRLSFNLSTWHPSLSPIRWLTEESRAIWKREPSRAEALAHQEMREQLITKILAHAPWWEGSEGQFHAYDALRVRDLWVKSDVDYRAIGFVANLGAWKTSQGYPILARHGLDGDVTIDEDARNYGVFLGSLDPLGGWFSRSEPAPGLWATEAGTIMPDAWALLWAQVGLAVLCILDVFAISAFARSLRALLNERAVALAQSGLVSGVSHEMRTPLTTVKLYAEMLGDGLVPTGEHALYCQTIVQESDRLSRLIENVLDYARISGRRRSYRFERADLGEIAAYAANILAGPLASAGMALESDLKGELQAEVDRDAIVQVLVNLIGNAIKYASGGKTVKVGVEGWGGLVVLWVADHGPGLDKAELRRIFKPFYRGQAHANSAIAGTGLGLALVAEHVKAHQGHLEVRSVPMRGATFIVTLPREHGG